MPPTPSAFGTVATKDDVLPPSASLDSSSTWHSAEAGDGSGAEMSGPSAVSDPPPPVASSNAPSPAPLAVTLPPDPSASSATTTVPALGPVVGLQNLGNTCYLNAAMQLLLACQPLMQELRQHEQQAQLESPHGALPASPLLQQQQEAMAASHFGKGPLACAFQQAILDASGCGPAPPASVVYSPQALLAAVRKRAPNLKGRQQQDSHEVLHLMLEGLEAEERRSRQAAARQLQQQQQQQDQGMSLRGGRVLHASSAAQGGVAAADLAARLEQWVAAPTLVERVFGGRLASAIVCCSCGFESVSSEPFLDLSLPLPQQWLALPDQQRMGSGAGASARSLGSGSAGRGRAAGDGEADAAGALPAASRRGKGVRIGGPEGYNGFTSLDPEQQRGRYKRKSVDEPCLVPFVSPVAVVPPPAAAVGHGWTVHAMGQRTCPTMHGVSSGVLRPGARSSSSDLHALPSPMAPVACTAGPAAAAAVAAAAAPAVQSPGLVPGPGQPPAAADAAEGVSVGSAVAGSSSSSSNSSCRQGLPAEGGAVPLEPAASGLPAATTGGAVTRAKARRLCDRSGKGVLASLAVAAAAVGAQAAPKDRPDSQQQAQPGPGLGAAAVCMEVDGMAAGIGAGAGVGACVAAGVVGRGQASVKQEQGEGAVPSGHASGEGCSPWRASGQLGRLWVGMPQDNCAGVSQPGSWGAGGPQAQPEFLGASKPVAAEPLTGSVGAPAVGVPAVGAAGSGADLEADGNLPAADAKRPAAEEKLPGPVPAWPHLRLCLSEFFQKELIHWDCPRDNGDGAGAGEAGFGGAVGAACGSPGVLCGSAPAAVNGLQLLAQQQRQQRRGAGVPVQVATRRVGRPAGAKQVGLAGATGTARRLPRNRDASCGSQGMEDVPVASASVPPSQGPKAQLQLQQGGSALARGQGQGQGQGQASQVRGAACDVVAPSATAAPVLLPARRTRRFSASPAASAGQQGQPLPPLPPLHQGTWSPGRPPAAPILIPGAVVDGCDAATRAAGAAVAERNCCAHRAAKSYRLHAVPPVLLVHLKRFRRDDSGAMRKVGVHVGFDFELDAPLDQPSEQQPVQGSQSAGQPGLGLAGQGLGLGVAGQGLAAQGLGLGLYGSATGELAAPAAAPVPAPAPAPASASDGLAGLAAGASPGKLLSSCRYQLAGVVEHTGSMKSGHYVAYVCRPRQKQPSGGTAGDEGAVGTVTGEAARVDTGGSQQWYCVSDTSVRPVGKEQVLAAQAYMLMYVRQS